ncbi:MAG: carbohydrate porin [Cyanobacteriota bacterium]
MGLQWTDAFIKGNILGMAVGQPTFITDSGASGNPANDAGYVWEGWYKIQVTDHITVTPAIFYLSNPAGQMAIVNGVVTGNNPASVGVFNNFGGLVKTTFKF